MDVGAAGCDQDNENQQESIHQLLLVPFGFIGGGVVAGNMPEL